MKESKTTSILKGTRALRFATLSIFSALSVVGSFIHPLSPIQTVAFDSSPGFFAALYFGALDGALISGIGHISTSIVNGFPLGFLHLPIALGMALAGGVMGLVNKANRKWSFIPAAIAGISINTALSVVVIPTMGWATAVAFVPFLLLAASLNAAVAALTYIGVRGRLPT